MTFKHFSTEKLKSIKKNLWARYIFGGRENSVYEQFCEVCQELAKRETED